MKSITPISASAVASLRIAFRERFGREAHVYSAPGRVNLIGEHTDYNDGFVLPMTIQQRLLVAAARREDSVVRAYSNDLEEEGCFDLSRDHAQGPGSWLDYVEGVARTLAARGLPAGGADLMITSEVPRGAGLSSSAALELATALALTSLHGSPPDPKELALVGQLAEQRFVGVQCGIMDQMVSALGRIDHALLIDCRNLDTTHVRLALGDARLLICDTGVRHSHTVSGYNDRRRECQAATETIQRHLAAKSLRDVRTDQLPQIEQLLPHELFKRVRHVVSENQRTLDAVRALESEDMRALGELMLLSHASLRDDFEVSCPELDFAVDIASKQPGVLGARMTGGGFGGALIALVLADELVSVSERVASSFKERFGHLPELRVLASGEGMREDPSDA